MFSSLAIQGLVKKGACLIILMVSLSKCEIDSSSTTESGKVQEQQQLPFRDGTLSLYSPSTTTIRSFSASSEDGFGGSPLVRTSYSFSSSLSSKEKADDDDGTTSKEAKEHQPSHSSYQTSVISISSITPSSYAASQQDLTSFRSPEQEAGDKKQAPEQQLGHVQQHARNQFTDTSTGKLHQSNNDNGSNKQPKAGKRQTSSLSPVFPGKREEQMSEVSFPAGNAPVTSAAPAPSRNLLEPPPATNSFERRFPLSTVPGSHRRRAISSDDGEQSISPPSPVSFGKYTNNASELETGPSRSSLIPVHTSIPTGLSFSCRDRYPGYYSDSSDIAKCQVSRHYCTKIEKMKNTWKFSFFAH